MEVSEVKERLKNPKHKDRIAKAIAHEARLKLHCKTSFDVHEAGPALTKFTEFVRSLLPHDKYSLFLSLLRFPLPTIPLTAEIFEALHKVFEGQNPVEKYEFLSEQIPEDWSEYRKKLKPRQQWQGRGFEAMKYGINSALVVDLPEEQESGLPEPYFYWLPIGKVIDYELADMEGTELQMLAFHSGKDRITVLCDDYYRVFQAKDGNLDNAVLLLENPHDLEYCPARFFWSTPISWGQPERKMSPITNYLERLDWFLFFFVSKRHLDLYAPYPIYSGFSANCDYEEEHSGNYCDAGFLKNRDGMWMYADGGHKLQECPRCSRSRLAGVGSFVEVDPPDDSNNMADLRNPIQVVPAEEKSLKYNTDEIKRLALEIYSAVTGGSIEVVSNQAINEKQVMSLFESRKATLERLKNNFEQAQIWVESTICRLRYGSNAFVSAFISYGTEFYLFSAEALLEMYQKAREAKLDAVILDDLQEQYFQTKYRNNPDQLERIRITLDLDPMRHLTTEEAQVLRQQGAASPEDYAIKANFSTYLARFERENMPITEFASGQSYDRKIQIISEALRTYIPAQQTATTIEN